MGAVLDWVGAALDWTIFHERGGIDQSCLLRAITRERRVCLPIFSYPRCVLPPPLREASRPPKMFGKRETIVSSIPRGLTPGGGAEKIAEGSSSSKRSSAEEDAGTPVAGCAVAPEGPVRGEEDEQKLAGCSTYKRMDGVKMQSEWKSEWKGTCLVDEGEGGHAAGIGC